MGVASYRNREGQTARSLPSLVKWLSRYLYLQRWLKQAPERDHKASHSTLAVLVYRIFRAVMHVPRLLRSASVNVAAVNNSARGETRRSPVGANPIRPIGRSAGSNQGDAGSNEFVEVLCVKVTLGEA
jgi:hypothetical protein